MSSDNDNPLKRLLQRSTGIEAGEWRATLASFSLVLLLMAAYYIVRPVRDAMASDWSDAEVSWLWTFTFFFSAIAVALYGAAINRVRLTLLVPTVYGFFAASFIAFYLGRSASFEPVLLDKAFYVWISVFSLFHISVFWSLMADIFSRSQATRLFGFIGAGASVGAIIGPALPTLFAATLGTDNLLLIAATGLLLAAPLSGWLYRLQQLGNATDNTQRDAEAHLTGNPFAGFTEFFSNRFLLGIGVFILLYTTISSFAYFELKNLLQDYDDATRTRIWAGMDLIVNILTLTIAAFVTGRIASKLGLPTALACVPLIITVGMLLLAMAPLVSVVVVIQIVRRAGNYAITRPAREMLFTAVDRETRFRTKPVIDIVIYRGGDMLNAWAFTALTQGLGLGLAAVAGVGALIALLWAGVGVYLGRQFERQKDTQ